MKNNIMFVHNLVFTYFYINQKSLIIKKIFDCYFLQFSLCSLQSNSAFLVTALLTCECGVLYLYLKSFLKNFQKTSLNEMFQIKHWKNIKKYREESTKRM